MAIANLAPQALLRSDNDTRRQRRMRCRAKTGLAAALPRTRSLVIGQLLLEVFVFRPLIRSAVSTMRRYATS
jgi:hypothetical protein